MDGPSLSMIQTNRRSKKRADITGKRMTFQSWRGDVATISPTLRPGNVEEYIRLLPDGIGVMTSHIDIRRGTAEELKAQLAAYEGKIRELAPRKPDVIFPAGAPPFMVHGHGREAKIVASWERKYKVAVCTSGQYQIRALKTLGIKSIVGASYFPQKLNAIFAKYFTDAGFKVRAMDGIDVPFDQVQNLSSRLVYAHIKKSFLRCKGADAVYMLGSGWRTLDIVEMIEQDLRVPVIHPICAKVWETQKRLHVRERRKGYGILLATLP
jgi:maleate isomerase